LLWREYADERRALVAEEASAELRPGGEGPRADVLARRGLAELARAGEAAADDAVADARRPRRRAVPRPRHAGRRPAGPVDAARLPRPRPPRPRPPGRDRRSEPPHRGVPLELLPAPDPPAARRGRGARRPRDDRGAAPARARRRGLRPLDARPRLRSSD